MQVKEAEPHCQAAIVTLTVSHADTDMGTEVQCLNAFLKRGVSLQSHSVPIHVIRMEGPDMCIGAMAAMAAYPNILLQAAQLRQARSCFFKKCLPLHAKCMIKCTFTNSNQKQVCQYQAFCVQQHL